MARVICWVLLTLLMRRLMSRRVGISSAGAGGQAPGAGENVAASVDPGSPPSNRRSNSLVVGHWDLVIPACFARPLRETSGYAALAARNSALHSRIAVSIRVRRSSLISFLVASS